MIQKRHIFVNVDDFYASVLQKIISKNLSKCAFNLLYYKNYIPFVKNDDVCLWADNKLFLIVHLYANTTEKVIK